MLTPFILSAALGTVLVDVDEAELRALNLFHDEFVLITPGETKFPQRFQQGRGRGGQANERPVRDVAFSAPFLVGKYEVTQELWEQVMGNNPSRWKGARNSVEMVTYDEAVEFCQKVTEKMRAAKIIKPNQRVRLPSESEWEYVARAGTQTIYSFGDDASVLGQFAWFTGNAAGNDPPVGAKKPNAWGLYDVHGYLWEWTADAANDSYRGAPVDGTAWEQGNARLCILRGGSWKDSPEKLTSSYRYEASKEMRDDAVGFRCVLTTE